MENKVYPVLYYDTEGSDMSMIMEVVKQLEEFFKRQTIPFLCLPKETNLKYMTKEEAIDELNKLMEYVKTWE